MAAQEEQAKSVWFRLAMWVTRHPLKVVVAVLVVMSPLSYYSSQLAYTVDQNQLHARNVPAYDDWVRYRAAMPSGMTWPYALIAQPAPNATLDDAAEVVRRNNALIAELVVVTGIDARLWNGPTWLLGEPLNVTTALGYLIDTGSPLYNTPTGAYDRLRNYNCPHLSLSTKAIFTEIDTPFDPQGSEVEPFIKQLRAAFERHNDPELVTFHVALGLTEMVDVVDEVYNRMPMVMVVTVAVLLLVTALAFRSVVIALRLVFTLAVTLSWSFGSGVVVFQTTLMDWTGQSMADVHALSWMAPVMTFSLILSLGCDYDIFITTRIREFRAMGFDDRAAVVKGYYRTGGVITTAGVIMIISFGSLMLSSQMLLVECGFLLAWSVALDTFVVRSLLVPGLMVLLGRANWWPTRMPPGTKDEGCVDEALGRAGAGARDAGAADEHVALAGVREERHGSYDEEPPSPEHHADVPTW
uniref:Membrane transport protein MMPL domain-containing protein n=1 Tax=Bicosoecida sp. CB-2014 TaxID=1486930 RepID=A0A7S1CL24_9STRA